MSDFLNAQWRNLIMANYEVDPKCLEAYIPKGVELDLFNGIAYVSLVGFLFERSKIFGIPVPVFGTFEEINLRFYVVRKLENEIRRGVVFIQEAVPNPIVAWLANTLYKEHYKAVPTRREYTSSNKEKFVQYRWKFNQHWNTISVKAGLEQRLMKAGSIEEFIYEHYYGYTKVNEDTAEEYNILHPKWLTNEVLNYSIECDFLSNYGKDFTFLQTQVPASVMLAEGSAISIKWKRNKIE